MTAGLNITFETLAASRNDAANAALLKALESTDVVVYNSALKAIIGRRNKAGHRAVLARWHRLSPEQQEFLQEGRGRMSGALRDAVLSDDDQMFANACELVEKFKEYDLTATLVTLAENQKSKHAEPATQLVLRLVKQLSEMAHGARDENDRRNPEALCRSVLESLERSVERFRTHKRSELIEAFVILGGPKSDALHRILDEPHHPCYLTVISTLTTSQCVGVLDYLFGSLQNEVTSQNILNVISKRDDHEFVGHLLALVDQENFDQISKNLARIRTFAWLQASQSGYNSFSEENQVRCIKLVAASGVKTDAFLNLLDRILKRGAPAARWAACDALATIPGDRGNHLVLDAIDDQDPNVQAAATRQLRDRHVHGAMAILLRKIDSPHPAVREATCEALSEFSFANFLVGFEGLHEDARRTTGALVKKVDSETIPGVLNEMADKSRKRRLRALQMAEVMELVPQVAPQVMKLLEEDEDHLVRAAAADVLQYCPTAEAQEALRRAANAPNGAVQNAAKNSLAIFDEIATQASTLATAASEGQR